MGTETGTGLYPTPTRLQLLADIYTGLVHRDQLGEVWLTDGRTWKVTDRVKEMETAGWVVDVGPRIERTALGDQVAAQHQAAADG